MSRETSEWLNRNVLVGMTDKRGNAWHYRSTDQGDESNHYPGAIPVEDVERRLFDWDPIVAPSYSGEPVREDDGTLARYSSGANRGEIKFKPVMDPDRRYIIASDTGQRFSVFSDGYVPHGYREWLLKNVSTILDDSLVISSAGLLDGRGIAWVECSVPENVETPEGVTFRPNVLATTSLNGRVSTTYSRTITETVCDNTLNAALSENGPKYKLKHTKYSALKIGEARDALAIVYEAADEFSAEVKRLCSVELSDANWQLVLREVFPDPTKESKTGATRAANLREKLDALYRHDNRVSPWAGTAFGAVQAMNTFNTHVRNANSSTLRAERIMTDIVTGKNAALDKPMYDALDRLVLPAA